MGKEKRFFKFESEKVIEKTNSKITDKTSTINMLISSPLRKKLNCETRLEALKRFEVRE